MTSLMGRLFGVLALLTLLVTSCSSGDKSSVQAAIELTDSLGRVVSLEQVPQRLVSLAPSNTEILLALGLGDKVVGVTTYCNFPAEAEEKPTVGGFSTVDIEKVVSQAPDLVLAANIHEKEVIPQLESKGLNVMALSPGTVGEVIQAIDMVGRATGTESAARQLAEEMQARLDFVASLVKDLSDEAKPRVFYALWHDPLMTAGHDTLQSHIIELAGGKNIFDDLARYPTVNLEELLERQPQVIVAGVGHGSGKQATLDWATSEPRLENTEARLESKVFDIDADLVSRAGPRIVDAVEEMLYLIHPDLAAEL